MIGGLLTKIGRFTSFPSTFTGSFLPESAGWPGFCFVRTNVVSSVRNFWNRCKENQKRSSVKWKIHYNPFFELTIEEARSKVSVDHDSRIIWSVLLFVVFWFPPSSSLLVFNQPLMKELINLDSFFCVSPLLTITALMKAWKWDVKCYKRGITSTVLRTRARTHRHQHDQQQCLSPWWCFWMRKKSQKQGGSVWCNLLKQYSVETNHRKVTQISLNFFRSVILCDCS